MCTELSTRRTAGAGESAARSRTTAAHAFDVRFGHRARSTRPQARLDGVTRGSLPARDYSATSSEGVDTVVRPRKAADDVERRIALPTKGSLLTRSESSPPLPPRPAPVGPRTAEASPPQRPGSFRRRRQGASGARRSRDEARRWARRNRIDRFGHARQAAGLGETPSGEAPGYEPIRARKPFGSLFGGGTVLLRLGFEQEDGAERTRCCRIDLERRAIGELRPSKSRIEDSARPSSV